MSNQITIELCAEDRARIDQLTLAIVSLGGLIEKHIPAPPSITNALSPDEEEIIRQALAHSAQEPPQRTEPERATTTQPPAEAPTAPDSAPVEPVKPTVTLEQIQQKVMQLATGNGGAKKAKVREIINTYGAKVSDLKEQPEKWAEVWDKLTALESEG